MNRKKVVDKTPREPQFPSELSPFENKSLANGEIYEEFEFQKANFSGSVWQRGALEASQFREVDFSEVRFEKIDVIDAIFNECDLTNASWKSATWTRTAWLDCRLLGLDVTEGDWKDFSAKNCDARHAQWGECRFQNARFENCNLRGADFQNADLRGVVFSNCDLREANFAYAKLQNTDFRGSQIENWQVRGEDLKGAIVEPMQAAILAALLGLQVRFD